MEGSSGPGKARGKTSRHSKSRLMHARVERSKLGCAIRTSPRFGTPATRSRSRILTKVMSWRDLAWRGRFCRCVAGVWAERKVEMAWAARVNAASLRVGSRLTTHGEESWQGGTRMSSLRGGRNARRDSCPASGLLVFEVCMSEVWHQESWQLEVCSSEHHKELFLSIHMQ